MNSLVTPAVILGIAAYFGFILGSLAIASRLQTGHPTMSKIAPIVGCAGGIAGLAVILGALNS